MYVPSQQKIQVPLALKCSDLFSNLNNSGAPRAREARARGRSPIAKEIYPYQKIW